MSQDVVAGVPSGTGQRVEKMLPGGDGLVRDADARVRSVPFVLPGENLRLGTPSAGGEFAVLEPSPDRVAPACVHFGRCGGCQYQMATYPAQLAIKAALLQELFADAGLRHLPAPEMVASPEPYGYRNRIRLRLGEHDGARALGYNIRGSREFLPIQMCPIAAPVLWRAAEALLAAMVRVAAAAKWLESITEIEFFCTEDEARVQITLLCGGRLPRDTAGLARFVEAVFQTLRTGPAPTPGSQAGQTLAGLSGIGVVRLDPRSGQVLGTVCESGAPGISYDVEEERYWVTRGGFFQVNRFLLPALVERVCGESCGGLAWDLFAGVGLFSRVLARRFTALTAVEAHPGSCKDLRNTLARLGPQHRAVEATTVQFLRRAVLERDRPELVVMDPPRAGAGEEVCTLLARLAPEQITYLSCDPATLARDLVYLTRSGYGVARLHLIDLFPQTYHMETLAVLKKTR